MEILKEYLSELQDLLDNKVISEKEVVEIFREGVNNYLKPENTFGSWRAKYYIRKVYSTNFMHIKTEEGDHTLDELREIYYLTKSEGIVNKYKFRAECESDVKGLLRLLPLTTTYHIQKLKGIEHSPDIEVEMGVRELKIDELRGIMREVEDSQVMVQTLMPVEEYTGERNYDL